MNRLRLPTFVDSSDIIEASAHRHAMRLRGAWRLWREAFPFELNSNLVAVIEALLASAHVGELDTPRIRNWVTVSKGLAQAYRTGGFTDTSYTCQYRIDALDPGRLGQLHTLRLWEGLVDSVGSPYELTSDWCDIPLPRQACFTEFGRLTIPRHDRPARWRFVSNRSERRVIVEEDGPTVLLSGTRGNCLRIPATWSHEAPLHVSASGHLVDIPATCDDFATPYRGSGPIVNDHAACAQWRPLLAEALSLVADAGSELCHDCLSYARAALPLFSGSLERFGSQSPEESEGLVYLPGTDVLPNLAECFVHEAMHVKLFHIEALVPLFTDASPADDGYYSPWRPDPRPLRMLLHGCYVFAYVAFLWRQWATSAHNALPRREACEQSAFQRASEVMAGLATLRHFAALTPLGERLCNEIGAAAREVIESSAVGTDVRSSVLAAIEKHRQHHLKVSKCLDPLTF